MFLDAATPRSNTETHHYRKGRTMFLIVIPIVAAIRRLVRKRRAEQAEQWAPAQHA